MPDSEVQNYLAEPLQQELCKETLRAALDARVVALRRQKVPDRTIVASLQNLVEEHQHSNADVLEDMIEQVVLSATPKRA